MIDLDAEKHVTTYTSYARARALVKSYTYVVVAIYSALIYF